MVIDRYLRKEVIVTLLGVTLVLFLIDLSNSFLRFLSSAASGSLPGDLVLVMLSLKSISSLVFLLPLALFLSVLLALGRLHQDNEMIALEACGVGIHRVLRIIFMLALLFAAGIAVMALYAAPWAEEKRYQILDNAQATMDISGIVEGRFKESAAGNGILYVEELSEDRRSMRKVFAQWQRQGRVETVSSERAYLRTDEATGERYLVLINGYRYEGEPGSVDFRIIKYRTHAVKIEEREIAPATRKLWSYPVSKLLERGGAADIAELQRRLSIPIATLLLALLAVPLSHTTPRQGKYAKLLYGILAYVIYSNLLNVAQNWTARGKVPVEVGVWWVHGLFIAVIVILVIKRLGLAWFFRRFRAQTMELNR